MGRQSKTHGFSQHWLYKPWQQMVRRCGNPAARGYKWYGARGISVYPPWQDSPQLFIEYVEQNLGPRPPKHSLDRINNDGNYEPGNIRWADQVTQIRNSRRYASSLHSV